MTTKFHEYLTGKLELLNEEAAKLEQRRSEHVDAIGTNRNHVTKQGPKIVELDNRIAELTAQLEKAHSEKAVIESDLQPYHEAIATSEAKLKEIDFEGTGLADEIERCQSALEAEKSQPVQSNGE